MLLPMTFSFFLFGCFNVLTLLDLRVVFLFFFTRFKREL